MDLSGGAGHPDNRVDRPGRLAALASRPNVRSSAAKCGAPLRSGRSYPVMETGGCEVPPRRRRLRRLAPLAVVLALAGLVVVWVPLHRQAPARPASPVGP